METSGKIVLTVLLVIAVILIYINWDKLFPKKSNKADGAPCSSTGGTVNDGTYLNGICVPTPKEGSPCTIVGRDGIIIGGKCIPNAQPTPKPQPSSSTIQITNPNGARPLALQGSNFVSIANANIIPAKSRLAVTQYIPSPHVYYNTAQGWIDGNDATIV